MGSVRKAVTSACGRCFKGSCYGVGFVTSAVILIVMFWFMWCYLGLVSVPVIDGQRRALVHYSATTPKPNFTSPPTSPSSSGRDYTDTWNSTTSQNNIVGTRTQASESRHEVDPSKDANLRATSDITNKGDFDSRERNRARPSNSTDRSETDTRPPPVNIGPIDRGDASTANRDRYDSSPPRRDDEDVLSITSRAVSSSAVENRPLSDRVGEKSSASSNSDFDADGRRYVDTVPSRRAADDEDRRLRRPIDRDERGSVDDIGTGRIPYREIPVRDRDRRPVDSDRRDYDDLPRRRYEDDEYDRAPPPRRVDDGLRRRIADDRDSDSSYDRPRTDSVYRSRDDRVRDDRYKDTDVDRRYRDRYDDDRYERPRSRDDRYRTSDADSYTRDRYRDEDDRYRIREEERRRGIRPEDDRTRRVGDDEYRLRESDERYRVPSSDDRYIRPRSEARLRDDDIGSIVSRDPIRSPDPLVDRKTEGSVRRTAVDPETSSSVRIRDDVDRSGPRVRDDVRDDSYVERVRGDDTIRRYDDLPSGRDLPPRSSVRSRPVEDRIDDRDRKPAVSDDRYVRVDDRPYRRRDYEDVDEVPRSSVSKGDERVVDRDRPVYIAEDRDLSRSLSSTRAETALDQRSYSRSDDDYRRNRPRVDTKLSVGDIDDRYPPSSRRSDDKISRYPLDEDRVVSRGRYDDDEKVYRNKGDYGRDSIDPYDRTVEERKPSRKESDYDDRYYESRSRSRDPPLSRPVDTDRPIRAPVEKSSRDDYRPSDTRRYKSEPGSDSYDRRDDPYPERSTIRDTPRAVVREKRDPEPCVRSGEDGRDRGDCEESSPRRSQQPIALRETEGNSKPLSPREIIDASSKVTDVLSDRSKEVIYPVYDPRVGNLTSPDFIRPDERRGTTITNKRRRRRKR